MNIGLGIGIPFTRSSLWASIFTPSALFLDGSTQGVWYDPSDINLTWRRNLLTYTEQFDNAAWTKTGVVVTSGQLAPDGSNTAAKVVASAGALYPGQITTTPGNANTFTGGMWVRGDVGGERVKLDVYQSGIVDNLTAEIVLTTAWVFINKAAVATNSANVMGLSIWNTSASSQTVYIWRPQLEVGSTATPYQRITDGVQDYLQYQAQPVLYRDAAGTLPVTAVEQPVGLMLDKSKGLVLGPEQVYSSSISGLPAGGGTRFYPVNMQNMVAGKPYEITFTISNYSGTGYVGLAGSAPAGVTQLQYLGNGTFSCVQFPTGLGVINFFTLTTNTADFSNISVRELPGNHAFNSSGNSANFPVLSARYNLFTKTEDFSDAVWASVNCTKAVNRLYPTISGAECSVSSVPIPVVAGSRQKTSVAFKAGGKNFGYVQINDQGGTVYASFVAIDLSTGDVGTPIALAGGGVSGFSAVSNQDANGYWRLTVEWIPLAASEVIYIGCCDSISSRSITANGTAGVIVSKPDLRVTNDGVNLPAYQRVNTATDYDAGPQWPRYLRFNGVSQWLQTNSIDFTYGDKMFVCAGVRKLSDSAVGLPLELSANGSTNAGSFFVSAPRRDIGVTDYAFDSSGTTRSAAISGGGYPAPITNVVSGISNISGDQSILRINGAQAAISTTDQGTGNYGNYPMYIGARAGSSLFFNGRLYQLVIAAGSEIRVAEEDSDLFLSESGDFITAETTVAVIQSAIEQTEAFVNRKTSAF